MFIASAPIMPSARSPIYCAECGCEVDPTAWLCANCGKNLHEPDAMTSTRPCAPVTSKNSKPDFITGAYLFLVLLGVAFVVPWSASKAHQLAANHFDGLDFFLAILLGAEALSLWLDFYFDQH
jgi:hypothetical protein